MFHLNSGVASGPPERYEGPAYKEYLGAPLLRLPPPEALPMTVDAAIARRRSCRHFTDAPLDLQQAAQVLTASYGLCNRLLAGEDELLVRAVPSAGGCYPLEVYLVARNVTGLDQGIYHYAPLLNGLESVRPMALARDELSSWLVGELFTGAPAALLVFTGVPMRTCAKYGERGYRYVLLEAGHAAQNLELAASALGLGTLMIGGFIDHAIAGLLGIEPETEVPLYCVALGKPASDDPLAARGLAASAGGVDSSADAVPFVLAVPHRADAGRALDHEPDDETAVWRLPGLLV
jgi:SagB-type dehydrogenase family enzyme